MTDRLDDLRLAHYKGRRRELNRKFAWCCVLPPLGWFGRFDRIEAEHTKVNKIIHDLIRDILSTSGVIPTPAGTGGDDSHAEASAIGPGIAQNPSDPTNTEHRV